MKQRKSSLLPLTVGDCKFLTTQIQYLFFSGNEDGILLKIKKKQRDSGTSPVEKHDLKNDQKAFKFEDTILESEPELFASNLKWPSWDTLRTLM